MLYRTEVFNIPFNPTISSIGSESSNTDPENPLYREEYIYSKRMYINNDLERYSWKENIFNEDHTIQRHINVKILKSKFRNSNIYNVIRTTSEINNIGLTKDISKNNKMFNNLNNARKFAGVNFCK